MSRQLSRIRSIISEIEEIQKQGQSEGKAQMQHRAPSIAPPPVAPAPVTQVSEPIDFPEELVADVLEFRAPPKVEKEEVKPGKISLQLTGNIVVALQIENTDEVVEVRQVNNSIEIRFSDGKAVHLPLKNVA